MDSTFLLSILVGLLILGGALILSVYLTDPYSSLSQVQTPFTTTINDSGDIVFSTKNPPKLVSSPVIKAWALVKTGLRIPLYSLITREKPLTGDEQSIINQIHQLRFSPDKPYVITGSHYSDLYIRNMGVFFNALLDPRLETTEEDWNNRQRLALQTIAYDLSFITQNQEAVTTIVPLGGNSYTGVNIYRPPSDALYGILHSLKALSDEDFIAYSFPLSTQGNAATSSGIQQVETNAPQPFKARTKTAANELLEEHKHGLTTTLNHYLETTIDPEIHLIRTDIHLSSARDGIKRQSSFYDNVTAWKTVQLADELSIPHSPTLDHQAWKNKIIDSFWDEEKGIFKDELTEEETTFSADSLIVTSTGFLDLEIESDRHKLERILNYIHTEKLDLPFPLKYSRTNDRDQMHWAVRIFAPSYMGDGIWSHWGMEYVKALILVANKNQSCELATVADKHLETYKSNIEKYGGYPELYNADGTIFSSSLVHSVLHTGWVVNYEQAKMMREAFFRHRSC